ncbi:MAG: hypothetical protein QNI90_11780 [Dinoroseobacter sp.]|nr:hypothetical protein [Dinoroseobacter sp.]MDJ0994248.1 hypothetical protein [Dinoroseobacter sp.]
MKPQAYLSQDDLDHIEARARKLRAEAIAEAATALKGWLREHLTFGSAHKA